MLKANNLLVEKSNKCLNLMYSMRKQERPGHQIFMRRVRKNPAILGFGIETITGSY